MKRLCFVFLALVLVAGMALADPAVPDPAFTGAYQMVTTYMSVGGSWVPVDKEDPDKLVATYTSGGKEGACNKKVWTIDIVNHASIAQWITWEFSDTRWDWQVRKPGTYAADCISFAIQSNNNVEMTFSGFEPLAGQFGTIPVWYGFGDAVTDVNWMAALGASEAPNNMNRLKMVLPYEQIGDNDGYTFKCWTKIQVDPSTHSCEYEDSGVITLTLVDIKPWISAANGNFYNCGQDLGFGCEPTHMIAPNGLWYIWPPQPTTL